MILLIDSLSLDNYIKACCCRLLFKSVSGNSLRRRSLLCRDESYFV